MAEPISYTIFTVVVVALWIATFRWALKTHPFYAFVLGFGAVFTYFGEFSAIRLHKYFYGDWWLKICIGSPSPGPLPFSWMPDPNAAGMCTAPNVCIPIAVIAMESTLMFAVLRTTDLLAPRPWAKPFFDGVLALSVDMLLDPVVASTHWCGLPGAGKDLPGLAMWTWFTVPESAGYWFGIPWANYTAWLASVIAFTACARTAARFVNWERQAGRWRTGILASVGALAGTFLVAAVLMLGVDYVLYQKTTNAWQAGVMLTLVAISLAVILPQLRRLKGDNPFQWEPVAIIMFFICFPLAAYLAGDLGAKRGILYVWPVVFIAGALFAFGPYVKTLRARRGTGGS